jgi:glycosyltransferase involved in cell wall biosynthesis
MSKVSMILPSRGEMFLSKTVEDIYAKAVGEIEVIVILEGYWPNPPLKEHPNLVLIHKGTPEGLRSAVNTGASAASGKYIMKLDAHCMLDQGFDEKMKADCDKDWVVIPRRYSLEPEAWEILNNRKSPVDAHYLSYPFKDWEIGMHGNVWNERARARLDVPIDDEMSSQGSCYFMETSYYHKLGGMSNEGYGTFTQEFQEIGNKCWLSGGRVVINKKTWYAHLHKGKHYGRGYPLSQREMIAGNHYCVKYWLTNQWQGRKHDFNWLIKKFWPNDFLFENLVIENCLKIENLKLKI